MKILLHAGIDKAGSTAIQAHLHANRDWLINRGIFVPVTGLTRFGHRKLFLPERDPATWHRLIEELACAKSDGHRLAVISFEGLGNLRKDEISGLAADLQTYEPTVLFYLRDQAEVLQSGYLQNLKAGPQKSTIDDLRGDPRLLLLNSRDYHRMLRPFSAVLGDARICLLPFSRELLQGGNVVDDFLATLGTSTDSEFERLPMQQNPSLDIPSGRYLNSLDQHGGIENRDALVDDLLWILRRDGAQERWFLNRKSVLMLRKHYQASNEHLAEQFALPVDVQDFFGLSSSPWRSSEKNSSEKLETALQSLRRWHRWNGRAYSGAKLAPVLKGGGWLSGTNNQTWSCGQSGIIRFRVGLSRYAQRPRNLLLYIRGSYLGGQQSSEIIVNGRSLGQSDMTAAEIGIGASELGFERELTLELRHTDPEGNNRQQYRLDLLDLTRT